jgi:hypothetical protein
MEDTIPVVGLGDKWRAASGGMLAGSGGKMTRYGMTR